VQQPLLQWWQSVINLGWSSLRLPLFLLQSCFLPFPLVDSAGGLGRACLPAAKYFDAIYAVKQHYIKSTLMFNILVLGTEISMRAEFSHCQQNWYYGLQAMYSSVALKSGGLYTFGPTHCQKVGIMIPGPPQDCRQCFTAFSLLICNVLLMLWCCWLWDRKGEVRTMQLSPPVFAI